MIFLSVKMYKKYSTIKILHAVSAIVFVAVSCFLKYSILVTYLAILSSSFLFFIINIFYYYRHKNEINNIENPVIKADFILKTPETISFRYLAKESWSLLLNTLIIFGLIGSVSLGVYSSSYMLITCFTAAAPIMGVVMFPVLNKNFLEDPIKLSRFVLKIIPLIFFLGIMATIVSYFSIPIAIKLMKNMPDYAYSIFAIMILVIPFNYIIGVINSIFIIIKKQSIGMIVTFVMLVVNMALVYFGALYYQIKGVAVASVIGSFFQVVLFISVYLVVNKKFIGQNRNSLKNI